MAQQPQRENADAFSILMRPQPFLASIISETSIVSNDGSLEDSMVTDACPDFSSVYIVKANTSSCPSQTNSVETHFVISKRIRSANRSYSFLKELEVQIDRQLLLHDCYGQVVVVMMMKESNLMETVMNMLNLRSFYFHWTNSLLMKSLTIMMIDDTRYAI